MTANNLNQRYLDNKQPLLEEEIRSYCIYLFSSKSKIDNEIFSELCKILYSFAYDGGYEELEAIVNKLAESKHISLIEWKAWNANYAKFKREKEAAEDNLTIKPEKLSEEHIQASLVVLFSEQLSPELNAQELTSNILHLHALNHGYQEIEQLAKFFIEKQAINKQLFNQWLNLSKQSDPVSKITPFSTSSYKYDTQQDSFINEKTYRSYKLLAITEFANFLTQANGDIHSESFAPIVQKKMAIYSEVDNYANKNNVEVSNFLDFSKEVGLFDRRDIRDFDLLLVEFKQLIVALVTETKIAQADDAIKDTHVAHAKVFPHLQILTSYAIHLENLPILARAARELEIANVINTREADHVIRTSFEERTKYAFLNEGLDFKEKGQAFIAKKNLSHVNVIAIQALAENKDLNQSIIPTETHYLIDNNFQYLNTPLYLNICFAPYSPEIGINSFLNFYLTIVDKLINKLEVKNKEELQSLRDNFFSEILFNENCYPNPTEAGMIYKASCGDEVSNFYLLSKGLSNLDFNKVKQNSKYLEQFKQYIDKAELESEFDATNLLDETPFTPLKLDGQQSNEREIMDDDQKNITGLASVFVDASDPVALGNAIRSARLDAGLSQTQLIAITNISLSTLSRIETGKTKPTLSTLSEIAKATNSKLKIGFTLL